MKWRNYLTEGGIVAFVVMLGMLFVALLTAGCSRVVREVPVYVHDTTMSVRVERDSVFVDRWHVEIQNGDTVWKKDSVTVYRYVYDTDTVREVVERPVEVNRTVEVERPLTLCQKTLMLLGVAAIGVAAWRFFRFFSK